MSFESIFIFYIYIKFALFYVLPRQNIGVLIVPEVVRVFSRAMAAVVPGCQTAPDALRQPIPEGRSQWRLQPGPPSYANIDQ
jgi:hypothetical protein